MLGPDVTAAPQKPSLDLPSYDQATNGKTTPITSEKGTRRRNPADIRVIGACLPRTGTLSLQKALEILDLPTHHMMNVLDNKKDQVWRWNKASLEGNTADEWDDLLRPYKACVDAPSCAFYKELADLYPNAKIIVTTRDSDKWLRSLRKTMFKYQPGSKEWSLLKVFKPEHREFLTLRECYAYGPKGFLEGRPLTASELPRWVAGVLDFFAARNELDRVLVYDLEEGGGFAKLCPFLDLPFPDKAWPLENASAGSALAGAVLEKAGGKTWEQNCGERNHDIEGDAERLVAKVKFALGFLAAGLVVSAVSLANRRP